MPEDYFQNQYASLGAMPESSVLDIIGQGDQSRYMDQVANIQGAQGLAGRMNFDPTKASMAENLQFQQLAGAQAPQGLTGADYGKIGLGVGQLGLGLASYLDSAKTNKANRRLMGQQYEANKESLANRRADRASVARAFA